MSIVVEKNKKNKNKKFYITTPIYYANDVPHVGSAYTTIAADVLARYHRMVGDKTFFLTGTDEHGAKVAEKAGEVGKEPKQFVDEIAAKFQFAWDELNISNNNFIRTTEEKHKKAVQQALQYMYDKGDIYLGKYEGLYCQGCEQYKGEKDLVDGKCPEHGTTPTKMSEGSYMFNLSKYAGALLKKIVSDEFKIRPLERKNEIISLYKNEGLKDVSFSRENVTWGIPVPWDTTHTTYVWADAFLNYLTGLNWRGEAGKAPDMWLPDVQLMSKDILRVHATIWPAMLLSLGLSLPKQLFIHGYFLVDGKKMSKSLGNAITPEQMIDKYGVDGTRYLLMSATSFGHDGDISWGKFDEKYNADLANGIGNLVARSITLVEKMQIVNINIEKTNGERDEWLGVGFIHKDIKIAWDEIKYCFGEFKIDKALITIISGSCSFLDEYITRSKPWELIKNNDKRVGAAMYNVLERLRHIALMLWPFMPETAEKIWESLGLKSSKEMEKDFSEAIKWGGLEPGTKVQKGESLFPRI